MNTHPVPAAFLPAGIARQDRRAAMQEWLEMACGDYAVARVRFVAAYLDFVHVELKRHGPELGQRLFDGLYAVEDWAWSALRPLPRAWIDLDGTPTMADFAFWDGTRMFAILLAPGPAAAALQAAGITVLPAPLDLAEGLPASFRATWRGETLPCSPFRRPAQP